MDFTEFYEEADEVLTPFGVLIIVLGGDSEKALKCIKGLEDYSKELTIGSNQVPAIIFMDDEVIFGALDLWEEKDAEEVM